MRFQGDQPKILQCCIFSINLPSVGLSVFKSVAMKSVTLGINKNTDDMAKTAIKLSQLHG